mmetsp:Transcript_8443/g.16002  ORF Transcript_8443/g.16002 Transcript_8443/m.16002 type:complete len:152 (-) Transcript_8443:1852-2307(-)
MNATSVCLITFVTSNLLDDSPTAWGRPAVEINRRYAAVHGYRFEVYSNSSQPVGAPIVWSPVFGVLSYMQRFPECEFVVSLDGDAVVNNYDILMNSIIQRHMPTGTDLLFTCHLVEHPQHCGACKCTESFGEDNPICKHACVPCMWTVVSA